MRHASQLCRGLAEASRSLERPYIPRHVPLPSSSYSAAAQTSATTTPPKSSAPRRSSKEAAKNSEDARSSIRHKTPLKRPLSQRDATFQHRPSQPDHTSSTNTLTSKTHSNPSGRNSSNSNRSRSAQVPSSQEAERLMAAYPGLSKDQATVLLQTFRRIQSLRSHAPGALVTWYEELIWTTERQAQERVRIESPQSLSMLLRFAYQRNDLRSLLRIESRAARLSSTFARSRNDAFVSNVSPKELGSTEVDGISIWPEPGEDPRRLAYNLKVAFAAREGNWLKVDELLTQPSPSIAKSSKGQATGPPTGRSEYALDATGWGGLLRFGLGSVQRFDVESRNPVTSAVLSGNGKQVMSTAPTSASETLSFLDPISSDIEAEKLRKAKEDEMQAQAKLSVTKRLLPYLLRFTSTPKNNDKAADSAQDATSRSAEPTTPVWLLHAVLAQLAERGDAASTVRIAQLALSEKSALEQLALVRGGATSILNFALMACSQNHSVNLTETLRIFNNLTGSQLGLTISGSTVLAQPSFSNGGKGQSQSKLHLKQSSDKPQQHTLEEGRIASAGQAHIIPNEESLVLVLKKVRHPLFRAAWTRKLVDEFQQLLPTVKLSGRTFRIIIEKCVAPAPGLASESVALPEPAPSATAEHPSTIASGRRGRRLRQQAAEQILPDPCPVSLKSSKTRGPIIKRSILSQTLTEILTRFRPNPTLTKTLLLHLSTTNRRRFEHTLLKAKRCLLVKKQHHMDQIARAPTEAAAREGFLRHEKASLNEIDNLLDLIAKVQRLGRSEETRKKKDSQH
ncbi:uncharacterized protein UTRI_01852_B [Ustilago trichophora]|uniref:Uncharacterized protein n=1 Tax=Ustilago trichophora TaxID=86804 RepID=A0A5C3DTT0_9BASI|nr:uncharacterized protein UTRI_01852_B [Ustilago trichophora]